MNLLQIRARKHFILGFVFFLLQHTVHAQNGEQLFKQYCASCHSVTVDVTGPALGGVLNRGPWAEDKKNVYAWVHDPTGFMSKDPYTQGLKAKYNAMMTAFPQLKEAEIDAILDFVMTPPKPDDAKVNPPGGGDTGSNNQNAIIFGVISLILAVVALILMQVNSNLKKLSDDKERIHRPEPVPFYRNKVYIALIALVLFVVGGYFVGQGAIGLGRQQGYSPTQPIYFSHKVHAGINQVNCLYCHSGAWDSKHALIPSENICMNCHRVVTTYTKGPTLYDEEGNKIDGTGEIQKLYKATGFSPGPGATWDASKGKPIEWVKIHNLPDHVYFNHAQHVRVGNVQCQTCHGSIQEMNKVKQEAELSMGWCVNCHRETKVNFNYDSTSGNQFYSIYEKFHKDIKNHKMDSVTVKDIGGLECQKCHY
ncbi:MAG: cytochrome c3 family protein [Flavisolibacter sp.]